MDIKVTSFFIISQYKLKFILILFDFTTKEALFYEKERNVCSLAICLNESFKHGILK